MKLLVSFTIAVLIVYFMNNKKLRNKHIKQVITLTVGVYLLFIVACGLCRSLEGFDNQEKSIEYYCGKCRTVHQQAHDEFIPHRNLVKPKPINEKEAEHDIQAELEGKHPRSREHEEHRKERESHKEREERREERREKRHEEEEKDHRPLSKVEKVLREHDSRGTKRTVTNGLEKDEGTNVNINLSLNIRDDIITELRDVKDHVNALAKERDHQMKHHIRSTHHEINRELPEPEQNDDNEINKHRHRDEEYLEKRIHHPDTKEKTKFLAGYAYMNPSKWDSVNRRGRDRKRVKNEGDRHRTRKGCPKSTSQFFEI